jgi:DEAD/DEAH box helicase domain-containing protein
MDAVILVGYPGTIASTRQQAGRAGRKQGASLAMLVASSSPLDQYLMQHPEFIFERSPEQALINPDNLLICSNTCAALPLNCPSLVENLWQPALDVLNSILDLLAEIG